jgi:hypothetical protein
MTGEKIAELESRAAGWRGNHAQHEAEAQRTALDAEMGDAAAVEAHAEASRGIDYALAALRRIESALAEARAIEAEAKRAEMETRRKERRRAADVQTDAAVLTIRKALRDIARASDAMSQGIAALEQIGAAVPEASNFRLLVQSTRDRLTSAIAAIWPRDLPLPSQRPEIPHADPVGSISRDVAAELQRALGYLPDDPKAQAEAS